MVQEILSKSEWNRGGGKCKQGCEGTCLLCIRTVFPVQQQGMVVGVWPHRGYFVGGKEEPQERWNESVGCQAVQGKMGTSSMRRTWQR